MDGDRRFGPMANILLVDDDPDFIAPLRAVLEARGGHAVDEAHDGQEALERLETGFLPDLVISDVVMPRLGGFELIEILRMAKLHVPIVFTSTLGNQSAKRLNGLKLGAVDFIAKPCDPEEMFLRVERLLERQVKAVAAPAPELSPERPPPRFSPPDPARPPESHRAPEGAGVDGALFPMAHVSGRIERLPLAAWLVLTEAERKTGIIGVRGPVGTLWLTIKQGRPFRASMSGGPDLQGEAAIYAALSWTTGRFEFLDTPVDGEPELECSVTGLLMEHARLSDEGQL